MTPKVLLVSFAALVVGLFAPAPTLAGTLDQSIETSPYRFSAAVGIDTSRGQTITAGFTGLLDRVDIQANRKDLTREPLTLEVRTTAADGSINLGPEGLLGTASRDYLAIPVGSFTSSFTAFDFSTAPILIHEGQRFGIVAKSDTPTTPDLWYLWTTSDAAATPPAPDYADGEAWYYSPSLGAPILSPTQTSGFRTFMIPVPEPSAALLTIAGALFCRGRSQRKRSGI